MTATKGVATEPGLISLHNLTPRLVVDGNISVGKLNVIFSRVCSHDFNVAVKCSIYSKRIQAVQRVTGKMLSKPSHVTELLLLLLTALLYICWFELEKKHLSLLGRFSSFAVEIHCFIFFSLVYDGHNIIFRIILKKDAHHQK